MGRGLARTLGLTVGLLLVWGSAGHALTNTLLGTNQLGNCAGNLADGGHNLTFGAAGCPNTFTIGDPKLRLLRNNGGLTETLALKAGSAAIDGVPASGAGCPATDQRGVRRPSGPACDIGAYERTPPVAITRAATGITHRTARLHGSATADAGSASIPSSTAPPRHTGQGHRPGPSAGSPRARRRRASRACDRAPGITSGWS